MRLLCLLPVRNGAFDLDVYLDSVAEYADGLIALDDGSTDETFDILSSHSLVLQTVRNPRRETYVGWSDIDNRRRLLKAAEDHRPGWIVWVDADEVIERSDAAVLRRFIEEEAEHEIAYSFEVLRMIDDLQTYDKCAMWVPRLYSFAPGYTLPDRELHFELVPEQFGTASCVRTSIRILHRASLTEERRVARYRKYDECDPDRRWQESYENLLAPARNLKRLRPRQDGDPVILPPEAQCA